MQTVGPEGGADTAPPGIATLRRQITGLSERPIRDLREAWTDAWGMPPPKGARRRLLMLGIAWKWQVDIHGGLPRQLERRLAALEAGLQRGGTIDAEVGKQAGAPRLPPGARLIRVWKGERHEVHVTETGFLWRGRSHASLSMIAREITGSRRNGPAFFGLRNGDPA